jgi:hypothetical protein
LRQHQTIEVRDVETEPGFADLRTMASKIGFRSFRVIPLTTERRILVTHEEMAQRIGASRETVTRLLMRREWVRAPTRHNPNNSRSRLVWARLTGISVCFLSSMRN